MVVAGPSWASTLLRSMTGSNCAPPLGDARLSRVPFPTALEEAGSDSPGFASPGYAASPGFHTLLTPCSSRDPSTVFQIDGAPGIPPFEGFPFRGMVPASRWGPARLASADNGPAALDSAVSSPAFRAFVSAEVRCRVGAEAPGRPVPPLGFLPSRGSSPSATTPFLTASPLMGFVPSGGQAACRFAPFRVSIAGGLGGLLGDRRPSWGSCTSSRRCRVSVPDRSITTLDGKVLRSRERVKNFRRNPGFSAFPRPSRPQVP